MPGASFHLLSLVFSLSDHFTTLNPVPAPCPFTAGRKNIVVGSKLLAVALLNACLASVALHSAL